MKREFLKKPKSQSAQKTNQRTYGYKNQKKQRDISKSRYDGTKKISYERKSNKNSSKKKMKENKTNRTVLECVGRRWGKQNTYRHHSPNTKSEQERRGQTAKNQNKKAKRTELKGSTTKRKR